MKKIVLAATISSLFAGVASANDTKLNTEHGTDKETKFGVHQHIGAGFGAGLEIVTAENLKYYKETNLQLDYQFDITDSWYVKPQFELSIPHSHFSKKDMKLAFDKENTINGKLRVSNKIKTGIETGFRLDSGLYTSARYRFETNNIKESFKGKIGGELGKMGSKAENKLHRLDLKLGYEVSDVVDLSANYIYKRSVSENSIYVQKRSAKLGDLKTSQHEVELKAAYIGFGDLQPYAMYTYKSDLDVKTFDAKFKDDNVFSVGLNYSF
ncbi:hypothetical protein JCM19231_5654 [Vibrio ishigakensis]|uniref:Uncharacterized protein n=1 Tax=Vibrio ishigakensis TaxID=1481914 RepID=A0A0B8NUQ4_9VIBR|nr:hypothetical protein [Vibrio ishigakensis]GAM56017.1 hypothetical protein JCM19231_5654 [Vibrio ishigakensis]